MSKFEELILLIKDKNFKQISEDLLKQADDDIYRMKLEWERKIAKIKKIRFDMFTEFIETVKQQLPISSFNMQMFEKVEKEYKDFKYNLTLVQRLQDQRKDNSEFKRDPAEFDQSVSSYEEDQLPPFTSQTSTTIKTRTDDQVMPADRTQIIRDNEYRRTAALSNQKNPNETERTMSESVHQTISTEGTSCNIEQTPSGIKVMAMHVNTDQTKLGNDVHTTSGNESQATPAHVDQTIRGNADRTTTECAHSKKQEDMKQSNPENDALTLTTVVQEEPMGPVIPSPDTESYFLSESKSHYASLFVDSNYKKVAREYCNLFNKDRARVHQIIATQFGKGKAEADDELFKLLEDIYKFVSVSACKQFDDILATVNRMVAKREVDVSKMKPEHVDILRQYRMENATLTLTALKKGYKSSCIETCREVDEFIAKCIELMWCICIYDPAMLLDFNTKFDTPGDMMRVYRPYKPDQQGKRIQYSLWPPLILSKTGDVLVKGLAHLR